MEIHIPNVNRLISLIIIISFFGSCINNTSQEKWIRIRNHKGEDSIAYQVNIKNSDTIKNGDYLIYEDKKIKSRFRYRKDQLYGWQEYYFPDGRLKEKYNYEIGLAQDSAFFFYPNGNKALTTFYKDDVQLFSEKYYPNSNKELYNVFWPLKEDSVFYVVLFDSSGKKFYENGNLLSNSFELFNKNKLKRESSTEFKLFCTQLPGYRTRVFFFMDNNFKDTIDCRVDGFYAHGVISPKKNGNNSVIFFAQLYDNNNLIRQDRIDIVINVE